MTLERIDRIFSTEIFSFTKSALHRTHWHHDRIPSGANGNIVKHSRKSILINQKTERDYNQKDITQSWRIFSF